MNHRRLIFVVILMIVGLFALFSPVAIRAKQNTSPLPASPGSPLGTAFTYQGRLTDGGLTANGSYNFRFYLWAEEGKTSLLGTYPGVGTTAVDVVDGYFTTTLDFGVDIFDGNERWLEIEVNGTLLSPLQPLTPTPYAIYAQTAPWSGLSDVPVGLDDGDDDTTYKAGTGLTLSGNEFNLTLSYLLPQGCASGQIAKWKSFSWVCANDDSHNHLGQTWTGSNNPLTIGGSFETEGAAPLVLSNSSASGNGLTIETAGNDGVHVQTAGTPDTQIDSSTSNGFEVEGAQGNGLFVGRAGNHGVHVVSTGSDGVRVDEAYQDGIQIGDSINSPLYAVYVAPPGTPYTAFWPNTENVNGEWALYTTDKIYADNVTASKLTLLAQVTGLNRLTAGDLVAVVGKAEPFPGYHDALPLVDLANARQTGVIGVVESRMAFQQAEGKEKGVLILQSVSGPAQDGDYVGLTVFGITEVKVDTQTVEIAPGGRLTASDVAGLARGLRSESLNGMLVTEGAPVVGIALESPEPGDTTLTVFVTLW